MCAALDGFGDERVGGRQDGRRRAVVAREREHLGAREAQLEVEDVARRGGAKAVDRLGVVADAGDAAAVGPQPRDDVGLQGVGVLVFVDQHVIEALAHALAGRRIGEQAAQEEQQVVVVEHLLLLLGVGVAGEEPPEVGGGRLAPGKRAGQHLGQRRLGVDAARVDVEAGGLLGEARTVAAEPERRAGDVQEVLGVAAVEDGEVGTEADVARVDAQQTRGDGVEGAAPDAGGDAARADPAGREERFDAAQHLGGGAAREGEQQDAPRVGAPADQVRHAVHEGRRLAGTGAGEDEQRSIAVRRGGELVGVELVEHERTPLEGCQEGSTDRGQMRTSVRF